MDAIYNYLVILAKKSKKYDRLNETVVLLLAITATQAVDTGVFLDPVRH